MAISVACSGEAAEVRTLLDDIDPARTSVARFSLHSATLDDVFFALTGQVAVQPEQEPTHV